MSSDEEDFSSSYEAKILQDIKNGKELPGKIDIPLLKFFWQSSVLSGSKEGKVPRFLRRVRVFNDFSELELRTLSSYLHLRDFQAKEFIFRQGEKGAGLYFVFLGHVDVVVENDDFAGEGDERKGASLVLSLERGDYFGELALLQQDSIRNASVIAQDRTSLLGLFLPDLEDMIEAHPVVAAKLLQAISRIIASRLYNLTTEVRKLKLKLDRYEKSSNPLQS